MKRWIHANEHSGLAKDRLDQFTDQWTDYADGFRKKSAESIHDQPLAIQNITYDEVHDALWRTGCPEDLISAALDLADQLLFDPTTTSLERDQLERYLKLISYNRGLSANLRRRVNSLNDKYAEIDVRTLDNEHVEEPSDDELIQFLKSNGIDTTKHKYELSAERYERFGPGEAYTRKFTCPGDWLAYFSMSVHDSPTAERIHSHFSRITFESLVKDNPSVDDIAQHAAEYWWGDGDDYIVYLKNLDTGKYLYVGDEEDY